MANNQFINLEELSKTTQALLSKINEQSNLKVNKANVSAEYSEGTKIADIEDIEIYTPEIDMSNYPTMEMLENLANFATNYNNLVNAPELATVATSGSYDDLSNKPTIPSSDDFVSNNNYPIFMLNAESVTGSERRVAYLYYGSLQNVIKYGSGSNGAPFLVYVQEPITGTTTNLLPNKIYVKNKYNNSNLINLKFYESRQPIVPLSYAFTLDSGFYYAELDWHDDFQDSTVMIYTYGFYDDAAISSRITTLENAGYQNSAQVNSAIATAIGNINSFDVSIVSNLPTTNISTHTIYFKSNSSSGNNIYDEYMYINSNWELIGSTQIDLTPYALSANLATVATSGDYDDLTDAPAAESDSNVENMLDSFDLDYTSNTSSPNIWQGGNY